ncbi:MAG: DUF5666 domain-containing protein, partial [Balneolaceae bacterium]
MKLFDQKVIRNLIVIWAGILILTGCSINDSNIDTTSDDLTSEELELAGQIIAESLSDQRDGIFSSLNDAFTLPSNNNFNQSLQATEQYSAPVFKAAGLVQGSQNESNYSYTYDPASGKHLVTFSRSINQDNLSKQTTAELEYIYYDTDNEYIVSPRLENDRIESIDFIGNRTGSVVTPRQNSSYERNDQFIIHGLTNNSATLSIEGIHEGSGDFKVTRENGDIIERYYELTVEFLNVEIDNQTVESNGTLDKGVTGALAYEMFITKTVNGDESMKTVNGTIEFNGDGTALLRFRNLLSEFKITLNSGTLLEENEFEGFIRSVDLEAGSFNLFDGTSYLITSETEISTESDLISLDEIEAVLENGVRVDTKGQFITDSAGSKIVQSIEIKLEADDVEFEELVENVDLDSNKITLSNVGDLFFTDESIIDEDGNLTTLEEVQVALEHGNVIQAEGEFKPNSSGTREIIDISFEFSDQDFEDFINSADSETQSFTLEEGLTLFVNDSTKFDDNIESIEEIESLLSIGYKIEAEGGYYIDADGAFVAYEIEFEIEEFDESEFEGLVESVNISDQSFALNNGLVFYVTSRTKFDNDIRSLNELADALNKNDSVKAKGEYFTSEDGKNMLIEVEFEIDADDNESEENEFEGTVQTVNLNQQSFVLKNGLLLHIDSNTEFEGDDITSIEELEDALQAGHYVEAQGDFYTDTGKNIVIEVEFEVEEENYEEKEFSGEIQNVNLNLDFFIVENGLVLYVDSNTEFDNEDFNSLEEVASAFRNGLNIKATGIYFTTNRSKNIVKKVE